MADPIAILGAGSWGTALAHVQAEAGHPVSLWDRDPKRIDEINEKRVNHKYHPSIELSKGIRAVSNLNEAVHQAEIVVLAIPSHAVRDCLKNISPHLKKEATLVCAAKGIEAETLGTLSSVAYEVLGQERTRKQYTVLSGPSFSHEVIRNAPTALTAAAFTEKSALRVQEFCHTDTFRIHTSDDVIGVEIAGALKNVVAVAAGASDGLGFGLNARAALITRALAEITKIGTQKGAHPQTFAGLSGLGDLLLTCTGDLSRNRQVGLKLAQGKSLKVILRELGQVAEGIRTAKAAYQMAKELHVDAPILEEIYRTLYERKPLREAVADLLSRAPGTEMS